MALSPGARKSHLNSGNANGAVVVREDGIFRINAANREKDSGNQVMLDFRWTGQCAKKARREFSAKGQPESLKYEYF